MPRLMRYLLSLDRDRLAEIAAAWGLPAADASPAAVYGEMTDLWALGGILEGLPRRTRLVLDNLLSPKHRVTPSDLARALPLGEEDLDEAIDQLAAFGLALRGDEGPAADLSVPDEVADAIDELRRRSAEPDRSGSPLERLLVELPYPDLQRLAYRWGVADADLRLKRELLPEVQQRLATRTTVRLVAGKLDVPARRLLTALVRAGGRADVVSLRRLAGLEERTLRAAGRALVELFLARESFAGGHRALFVPVGVGAGETPARMAPGAAALREVPGPPIRGNRFALVWDLLTLLAYLRDASPPVARLPLTAAHAKRLAPLLQVPEEGRNAGRLTFLSHLALGLGLVEEDDGRLRAAVRAAAWGQLDFQVQTLAAYRWWLATDRWREGLGQGDRELGGPLSLARGREQLVALVMANCAPSRWYEVAGFIGFVRQREPLLFRDREELAVAVGKVGLERAARHWERWDGRLARGALTSSLHWLGAVEVRGEESGGSAFALTDLGAWLVGREGTAAPTRPESPPLDVKASGEIVVRWPDGPTVAALSAFSRLAAVGAKTAYWIERESVVRAAQRGVTAAQILAALGRYEPVPPDLAEAIWRWTAAVKPLRAQRGFLLETEDAEAMDMLLASPRYARLRLRRLSATAGFVADEEAFAAAIDQLRKDGYLLGDGANPPG